MKIKKDNRGIAALMIVVVIGAAALILALSSSFLGLGELDMGYTAQKGGEVGSLADGCMEEALRQIQLNNNYGGDTLNLEGNSCIIGIQTNGNDRIITVSALVGNYGEKIQVDLTINNGLLILNSWQKLDS
ncbi:MAG: hypothetical protein HOA57_00010 [Candidatus Magasanikbacteria bacterium]|jgi:hypothetical protein|nr:hypothetical protein [Candidatus Magasanikbacteria bacterium]MBT4315080.1 hypothetical protein [Candidatus Magasanikbacteria bacterium]MBT4546990.1 hypothetical protein [Candidatus Magasanikbacteria bacterium]MBT6818760.1 hypothetical protein [Candidatus Magasanikbacteria bacterium]